LEQQPFDEMKQCNKFPHIEKPLFLPQNTWCSISSSYRPELVCKTQTNQSPGVKHKNRGNLHQFATNENTFESSKPVQIGVNDTILSW